MAANGLIDRAGVQTGATTDAAQTFAEFFALKYIRTAIVQKDYLHIFRAVRLFFCLRSANDGIITSDLLTGAAGR